MPIMSIDRQKIDRLLQKIIFVLLNIVVFSTPFVFTWFNQELFEFNKMIFVYIFTSLIVGLWCLRSLVRRQWLWQYKTHNYLILIFLLSQLVSTLFSIHPRTSIFGYYTRFNGGLLSIFAYAALFYGAQYNLKKEQLTLLLKNLLFAGLLISLYAIPERFGHSLSCLIVTGHYDVTCWVQDVQNRVFATFGQPNWLAAFLIMLIPLAIWQFWQYLEKSNKPKLSLKAIYYALLIVLLSMALLFTKSRSGLLALGIALIFQLAAQKLVIKKKIRNTLLLLPFVLILLVSIIFSPSLSLSSPNQSIISSLTDGLSTENSLSEEAEITNLPQAGGSKSSDIRRVVWQGAWKVWQRYPVFGSGVETFAYSYYQDRPAEHNLLSEWDFLYNKAHNELLNFLATTGIVGLLSYLSLFVALFIYLIKQWQLKQLTSQKIALASSLLAMFISNFFGFSTVTSNLLFAIFASVLLQTDQVWPKIKNKKFNFLEYLAIVFLLLAVFTLNRGVWKIWRADYLFSNGKTHIQQGNWQSGLQLIQKSIDLSPKEALFYDELASQYSILAIAFAKDNQATNSAEFAEAAIQTSNFVQKINPAHLNFYKSRSRIFIRLAQISNGFYTAAKDSLLTAIKLSPTEAKLYYNLALVEEEMGEQEKAIELLNEAIELKANYWQAYYALGRILELQGKTQEAADYYQLILEKIDPNNDSAQEALEALENKDL